MLRAPLRASVSPWRGLALQNLTAPAALLRSLMREAWCPRELFPAGSAIALASKESDMFGTSRCGSHHRSHFHGHGFFQQPGGYGPGGFSMGRDDEGFGGFGKGGGFGVRRPLRFLAYKLGLDEKQVVELARILDELKTERAQAEVDDRRTLAEFADALAGETFDAAKATSAGD